MSTVFFCYYILYIIPHFMEKKEHKVDKEKVCPSDSIFIVIGLDGPIRKWTSLCRRIL